MSLNKKNIESILELTSMQNAFLFHHLQEEQDQGMLLVELILEGELDFNLFQQAWDNILIRHSPLRTSIHWEKIQKPVQIIHKEAKASIQVHDFTEFSGKSFDINVEKLRALHKLNLSQAPVSSFSLVKKSETEHIFLWKCHHILLDGWSGSNIIKDLFKTYDSLSTGSILQLAVLPSQISYFNYLKKQKEDIAKKFWNDMFDVTAKPTLFKKQQQTEKTKYENYTFHISEEQTNKLKSISQKYKLTPNTTIKGFWSILLSQYFQQETVTFGTTVSGRSITLPNIEYMSGLFMNTLPVQLKIEKELAIKDWLEAFQVKQARTINFEHNTLNEIQSWLSSPSSASFDSLVIFQNFPWKGMKSKNLVVKQIYSDLKTNYPLNLTVKPFDAYEFTLRYDESVIDKKTIQWFSSQLKVLIDEFLVSPKNKLSQVIQKIETSPKQKDFQKQYKTKIEYLAPSNKIELQLVKLWEKVLNISPIGINDNFFDIGGKSLQAVRLLTLIQKKMKVNLPPITLMQNPTIHQLAKILIGDKEIPTWSCIVPLKSSGTKPPIFCLHGGGAHTFFYDILAKRLDKDQPVYSIQPLGLDDLSEKHNSIEEMAAYYVDEIKKVQPKGPYAYLTYCLSGAIGIEMNILLNKQGEETPLFIVIDSTPPVKKPKKAPVLERKLNRLKEMSPLDFSKAILRRVGGKYFWDKRIEKVQSLFKTKEEKVLSKMQNHLKNLINKYVSKPFNGKVILVASSEFIELGYTERQKNRWTNLASDGVELRKVEGKHRSLLTTTGAQVDSVAKEVQDSLDNFFQKEEKYS